MPVVSYRLSLSFRQLRFTCPFFLGLLLFAAAVCLLLPDACLLSDGITSAINSDCCHYAAVESNHYLCGAWQQGISSAYTKDTFAANTFHTFLFYEYLV